MCLYQADICYVDKTHNCFNKTTVVGFVFSFASAKFMIKWHEIQCFFEPEISL